MEEILQILLLLAYLAIGLVSITVPTYAISVSYLARETLKTLEDMRKRREDLSEKLDGLRKRLKEEPGVEGIKEEIKKFEEEEAGLKDRLGCLSAKGAVGYPLVGFTLGLVCAAYGIYIFPENASLLILASIVCIAYGLYRLAKSLLAVEKAALRPEEELLPRFRVAFASGSLIERFNAGEQREVEFAITNYEEIAEDVDVMFFFPPEFELMKKAEYRVFKQLPLSRYQGYNTAEWTLPLIHIDVSMTVIVSVKAPAKAGRYQIPVCIRARKIGKTDYQLSIEVV